MSRLVALISTSVALVGIIALAIVVTPGSSRAPAAPDRRSDLSPDPAVVHYRFADSTAAAASELAADIAGFEKRIADGIASPYDYGDLAALYLKRAQQTGSREDYVASEAAANKSIEQMPQPNASPLVLAKIASARHEFREAIRIARDYLTRASSTDARLILATCYLALGELSQASDEAERAASQKPSPGTYLMRALVFQAQGRDAEAAFDFSRAAAVEAAGDPGEAARVRTLWGRFLLRRGDATNAKLLFDEALRIAKDDPLALAYRGEAELRTGNLKQARALFEQAFSGARELRYLMDEARAGELLGDAAGAESIRTQVEKLVRAELRESGMGHRLDLVELLVDRGRPADLVEAVKLGREEVERRPSAETRFQLGRALARAGDLGGAQLEVRAALASGARDARLYELAAQLERALGNVVRADLYAREATKLDPGGSPWRTTNILVVPPHQAP